MPHRSLMSSARAGAIPLLGALILLALLAPHVQGQTAAPRTRVPREVQALLSTDTDTWLQGLAELRANPQARELILQALEVQPTPERRWRLIHHLAEFGSAGDVAVLVPLLEAMPEGPERRIAIGTLRALYPAPSDGADLSGIVKDFAFLQTAPPAPYLTELDSKYVLTELALQTYWLDRVSPQVMERVLPMKGRRFDSQKALSEALQSRLTPRLWQETSERLLAPVTAVPGRFVQDGMLRYRVENGLQRPVLLAMDAAVWFGRPESVPQRRFIYLKPGDSVQVDEPIRIMGAREPGRVRVDLRPMEVNGERIRVLTKLYVPMQGG